MSRTLVMYNKGKNIQNKKGKATAVLTKKVIKSVGGNFYLSFYLHSNLSEITSFRNSVGWVLRSRLLLPIIDM